MSRICKPTILINDSEYTSLEGLEEGASLELIIQKVLNNEAAFTGISNALLNPIKNVANISSFKEAQHVIPSNTDFSKINEYLGTVGRVYLPVVSSIETAINIIQKFGKPRILWIDGDIQINGASIPSVIPSDLLEDLIILKSHKLEDINNTLLEYIFKIILDNNGSSLLDIITLRFPIKENYNKRDLSSIVKDLNPFNIFDKLLYDEKFNRFIDQPKSSLDKKGTLRLDLIEEINNLLLKKNNLIPLYFSLNKVISGGLTGVDMIGVEVAKSLNYATGGTMPVGLQLESHIVTINGKEIKKYSLDPTLALDYGFNEISLEELLLFNDPYNARTKRNVLDSDGTIYFKTDLDSGGFLATRKWAEKYNKPFIVINWDSPEEAVQLIRDFIINNKVHILNIAGNRGSRLTKDLLETIREILKEALKPELPWILVGNKNIGISYNIFRGGTFNEKDKSTTYLLSNVSITPELKNDAYKMEMSFDYKDSARPGIISLSTFEAIIRGERTSTTRDLDSESQETLVRHLVEDIKKAKSNQGSYPVVAFYLSKEAMRSKQKENVIYAYVTDIFTISPALAEKLYNGVSTPAINDFIEKWVTKEGWSEEYLRKIKAKKILDIAKKALKEGKPYNGAVWIHYQPVEATIYKDIKRSVNNKSTEFSIRIPDGVQLPVGVSPEIKFDGSIKGLVNSLLEAKGVKKLSLMERKNLKELLNIVIQRTPQLKAVIGNDLDAYIDYLMEKFPNTLVKSIYWHGTNSNFSNGFETAGEPNNNSGASVINTGKGNMYFNKQAWTSLLYVDKVNRTALPDKDGFAHWNKLYHELFEIMANGRRNTSDWRDMIIGDDPISVREKIPNKGSWNAEENRWNEGEFDEVKKHGTTLESRKARYGYLDKTNEEFFREVFGIRWGQDTFNTWIQRNALIFKELEKKTNELLTQNGIGGIFPVIVNVTNPFFEEGTDTYYEHRGTLGYLDSGAHDAIIHSKANNEFNSDVLILKANADNIYFIGTPLDIEDFKSWKKSNKSNIEEEAYDLAKTLLTGKKSDGTPISSDRQSYIDTLIGQYMKCSK